MQTHRCITIEPLSIQMRIPKLRTQKRNIKIDFRKQIRHHEIKTRNIGTNSKSMLYSRAIFSFYGLLALCVRICICIFILRHSIAHQCMYTHRYIHRDFHVTHYGQVDIFCCGFIRMYICALCSLHSLTFEYIQSSFFVVINSMLTLSSIFCVLKLRSWFSLSVTDIFNHQLMCEMVCYDQAKSIRM